MSDPTVKNIPAWYRSRPQKIIAIKWDGTDETYATIHNFVGHALLAKQIYCGGLIMIMDDQDVVVRVGDYITRNADGTFTRIPAPLFEKTYDAV